MFSLRAPIFWGAVLIALLLPNEVLATGETNEVRVASYNVENYLSMTRRINGRLRANAGKPVREKETVTKMIGTIHPDILCLMEIGDPSQLEDLQRRLRSAGLDYPFTEYLQGNDSTRHVVLLSKYPILEKHSRGDLPIQVGGLTLHSPRGILDVTVELPGNRRLRLLGVHLKAKISSEEYDETDLRDAESLALHRLVHDILKEDPTTRLIVLGDFNDTKNARSIRQILGKPDAPDRLKALDLTDERGELWTEYWDSADVYSRIDYIMVDKTLEPEIDMEQSGIARPSFWNQASDHCPVFISIKNPATTP